MNNTAEKTTFFNFPAVKWLHLTGEVDKCVRCLCQICHDLTCQKLLNRLIFDRVIQEIEKQRWYAACNCSCSITVFCVDFATV